MVVDVEGSGRGSPLPSRLGLSFVPRSIICQFLTTFEAEADDADLTVNVYLCTHTHTHRKQKQMQTAPQRNQDWQRGRKARKVRARKRRTVNMEKRRREEKKKKKRPRKAKQSTTHFPIGDSPQHRTVMSVQSIADCLVSRRESRSWDGVPDGQVRSIRTSPRFCEVM